MRNILLISLAVLLLSCSKEDERGKELRRLEELTAAEEWPLLAKTAKANLKDYIAFNYYHLAQAYRGKLVEELFNVRQTGPHGLVFIPKENSANPCLAHVLFAMGNMAGAQNIAFNSLFTPEGIDCEMLKILALVELMRGCDKVADKYLDLLKEKKDYREWAENARKDPDIERGRKDFPKEEAFVLDSPMDDLFRILDANPSDSLAMQYGLSYLLLAKDMESTCRFIDRYFGSPALQTLPTPAQEALLFWSDYLQNVKGDDSVNREYCHAHGVTENTVQRFNKFQQVSIENNGKAPAAFRNTFWYYLLYVKI